MNQKSIRSYYTSPKSSEYKLKGHHPNISFYKNEIPAKPNQERINDILYEWPGNYRLLEANHSYIQWLFPNRDPGLNVHAHVLNDEEAKMISRSPELRNKVKESFKMMLGFYGMELTWDNQFQLAENSEERLRILNKSRNHNYLRISRILLGLKELGHPDLMLPWLKFLADLIYTEKKLDKAESSFENFWIETLVSEDKKKLIKYVNSLFDQRAPGISHNSKEKSVPYKSASLNTLDRYLITRDKRTPTTQPQFPRHCF